MRIQLLSDLHLETQPDFRAQPLPGADVLVLAGDIGSYQAGSQLSAQGDTDFGLRQFSPLHGWPTPVLLVPGNHEYDGLEFTQAHTRLRATCERLGIHWLERETLVLTGADGRPTRFVGTTLWTDFDALGPLAGYPAQAHTPAPHLLTQQLKAQDKAMRAANFYLKKTGSTLGERPWLADVVRELGLACQHWLHTALAQPFDDGPTVVVTHFAPSLRSADPRYGLVPGTAGFCNTLDGLMAQAQLWLHGHVHCPHDYQHLGCRVVANPLGYARKNEQLGFKPALLIDA